MVIYKVILIEQDIKNIYESDNYDSAFSHIVNYLQENESVLVSVNGDYDWIVQDLKKTIVHAETGEAIFKYGDEMVIIDSRKLIKIIEFESN